MNIYRKAGALRATERSPTGSVWHAVDGDYCSGKAALCGARPAIMWDATEGGQVSCPRCINKLKATQRTSPELDRALATLLDLPQ